MTDFFIINFECTVKSACKNVNLGGCRTQASWLQRRQARDRAKQLKSLMYGLMAHMGDGSKRAIDDLCNAREMAFVVTDLESSTAQASASAAAFAKVQEIHDTVRTHPFP